MNGSMHVVAAQHECCDGAVVRCTQFQVLHASLALLCGIAAKLHASMVSSIDAGTSNAMRNCSGGSLSSLQLQQPLLLLLESYRAASRVCNGNWLETSVAI